MENIDLTFLNTDAIVELVITIVPRLLGALLVLFVGWKIIKLISRVVGRAMEKRDLDATLTTFIRNFIAVALKILVVISVLGMIGIQMTVFIAIIGAAGLAIGLALSGTLQNFAGGVLILLIRPFKAGDFWAVFFEMNEKVYRIFPEKGLNIPFPQMDVHLHKTE